MDSYARPSHGHIWIQVTIYKNQRVTKVQPAAAAHIVPTAKSSVTVDC
jgi:hypothetical protein